MTLGKFFKGFRLDHDQRISLPSLHHYIVFGNCHAFCEDIMDFCMKSKSVGHGQNKCNILLVVERFIIHPKYFISNKMSHDRQNSENMASVHSPLNKIICIM